MTANEFDQRLGREGTLTLRKAVPGRGKDATRTRAQLKKALGDKGLSAVNGVYYASQHQKVG